MQNQHNLKPGTILNHYEIARVLGAGGFGITYLARNTKSNLDVVIKEYFPNEFAIRGMDSSIMAKTDAESDFQKGLKRFKEEAKTLVQFDHKTIVKILDYFEANNTAYFVMRDEGGIDLDRYMQQHRPPMSQEEVLEIVIPILEGLKEVHSYNYLHRDIKPGNILLRANELPVLIDFGASKIALGEVSKSITSILTEGYAPPEQYSTDVKQQGPFTDLYSLAAVMYKMITGAVPPGAQTRIYAKTTDKEDPYEPLVSQDLSQYDYHFLDTIDTALSLNAKQRPQTVQEFQAQLLGEMQMPPSKPTQAIRIDNDPSQSPGMFSFKGRINRLKYWLYSLVPMLVMFAGILPLILTTRSGETANPFFSFLMLAAFGAAIWISLAIQVKRWHDLDQSGWWTLSSLVPYVNIIVMIILGFFKGTDGPNRFGKDPLDSTSVNDIGISNADVYQNGESVNTVPENRVVRGGSTVTLLGMGHGVPPIVLTPNSEVIVGRSKNADITIDNKYVSSKHVALSLDENHKVQVRDLSSSNGTYLGGRKLEPNILYEFRPGERLLIASEDVMYAF